MKPATRIAAAGLLAASFLSSYPRQPLTGCWFPDDIISWSPETDADAVFNRSHVPLASRFREPVEMKANTRQHYAGEICNCTILFPTCGASPSQGAPGFSGYSPCFWQYMDKAVYWAGSSGEGIICPPPAYAIDAAHRNGVKILGNVFFPPEYYGGKKEWVTRMLTKEEDHYPYALKLLEIALWHGFDGWFINLETYGSANSQWAEFVAEFQKAADQAQCPWMEIQWYDASASPNTEILKTHKNVSQFLEYGAVKDYSSYAPSLGCAPEDIFSKIYCGVQCASSGHTGYNASLDKAFPASGHVASLDLFCPEERTWKDFVRDILNTSDCFGQKAYDAQKEVFAEESNMWVNMNGDPSAISDSWRGISGCITERSVISGTSFSTNMCNGLGKHRFVRGECVASGDWWNPGLQQVLPTWRWWIENGSSLKVQEDWDDAWMLGSSYAVTGTLVAGDHLIRLFKTELIPAGNLRIVYKANSGELIPMATKESSVSEGLTPLVLVNEEVINGWTVADYSFGELSGETVRMIALNLHADHLGTRFKLNLGEISVIDPSEEIPAEGVANLRNTAIPEVEGMDLRLSWDYPYLPDHFDIYVTDSEGRHLAGQTRGHGYYLEGIERHSGEEGITVGVVPVFSAWQEAPEAILTVDFAPLTPPEITLIPSCSYAKTGDIISVEAQASPLPQSWLWSLEEGLDPISPLAGSPSIELACSALGMHEVSAEIANEAGSASRTEKLIHVLDNYAYTQVRNVALEKTVASCSGSANSKETPENLLNGKTSDSSVSEK